MKVSICIPAYKQPEFLKRCLDSVFEQSYTDYEVIITDDSPDNEIEKLVNTYSDNRINYYHNIPALGSPTNWNKGIEQAKGEYIKILHHDDWFTYKYSLQKFVDVMEDHPDAEIIFSACNAVYSDRIQKKHITDKSFLRIIEDCPEFLFKGNLLGAPSICMFRNKGYFFDVNLKWQVDSDFYISCLKERKKVVYIPELLINIGISDNQITNECLVDHHLLINEKFYLYRKYNLDAFPYEFRNSMLRTLARGKVFNNKQLKIVLPDADLRLSIIESLKNRFYYFKHFIYRKLLKK